MKERACTFGAISSQALAEDKFSCSIQMGTQSNCSSQLHVPDRSDESRAIAMTVRDVISAFTLLGT
jgi:hypothetical protein